MMLDSIYGCFFYFLNYHALFWNLQKQREETLPKIEVTHVIRTAISAREEKDSMISLIQRPKRDESIIFDWVVIEISIELEYLRFFAFFVGKFKPFLLF
jgi:hypothetical protein